MASATLELNQTKSIRIESIDLLRGIVMIIMAIDHVRDYFHADAFLFNPTDLSRTSTVLFFTRWITHFCAPVFVFLAGTSAYLVGIRKGKAELSAFLFKRGIWLIVLEFTVINFSWFFNVHFSFIALTVICALAMGMILLSVAIYLPFRAMVIVGLILVAGHNLFDGLRLPNESSLVEIYSVLFRPYVFQLGHFTVFTGYPILPWAGVMLLGYCFGSLYTPSVDAAQRKKILVRLGVAAIVTFIVVRFINAYGDPFRWEPQSSAFYTFLSFINVTKYPPSLFYILATLGPAFLFLAWAEKIKGRISRYVVALGRVPMFFYIVHIYAIHLLALIAALATGFTLSDMTFTTWITDSPNLKGYGFSLGFVYLVWLAIVLGLYPLCLWYERYKTAHKEKWWLSYL
ncbi:MAG TPA: heparan-alpha-glucosaminide N-acetyltransferase domain-containing protein [Cyclobacteriaceae bacterium]|jgi:uncharacterized membrane protein|nr:heparan-alpha-glucosaminide N-acetyltransferase domain-containing protein [Cyclobacteriaceae bacterium]